MSGITVEQLRAKYPEPTRSPASGTVRPGPHYCVGGALALELGFESTCCTCGVSPEPGSGSGRIGAENSSEHSCDSERVKIGMFPTPSTLAMSLLMVNPLLTYEVALTFAKLITRKNDTGNFETAWGLLGDALAWTDEAWTPEDDTALSEWAEASR